VGAFRISTISYRHRQEAHRHRVHNAPFGAPRAATPQFQSTARLEIFLAAKHPKNLSLDGADLLSRAEDAEYAADVIATWAKLH
jgi:hypothetical protein